MMETKALAPSADRLVSAAQPHFSGMSHVSLPCRDLEGSKLFYSHVMGGELVHEIAGFVEYRIVDIIIGLSEQSEGWTGFDDEYLHYAFYLGGTNFDLMKGRLERYGVPNYPYRRDDTALSYYFRDPSGNRFEMYCPKTTRRRRLRARRQTGRRVHDRFCGVELSLDGVKRSKRPAHLQALLLS